MLGIYIFKVRYTISYSRPGIEYQINDLKKYAAWMIHPPDVYTFCKWFVLALRDSLCNEVLKKG